MVPKFAEVIHAGRHPGCGKREVFSSARMRADAPSGIGSPSARSALAAT